MRYNRALPVILAIFGLVILVGCLMSLNQTKVSCGPDTMRTDEICREYYQTDTGRDTGDTIARRTYDQQRVHEKSLNQAFLAISALMIAGGTVWWVIASRNLRNLAKSRQRNYAAAGFAPPYPPPVQPHYPPPVGQPYYPPPGSPPYYPAAPGGPPQPSAPPR